IQRKDAVRGLVEQNRVGILGGGNAAEDLETLQVEHQNGGVVAGCGETMAAAFGESGSVGAVEAGDLAEQLSRVFVDNHDAVLARDKQPVTGRIRDDIVPAAV